MADIGSWVMKSKLMEEPFCKKMVVGFTKHTFYDHFCAGINLAMANRTAVKLGDSGLTAMLDYGLEYANDNESCDCNMEEFIRTIDSTKLVDNSPVSRSFHVSLLHHGSLH